MRRTILTLLLVYIIMLFLSFMPQHKTKEVIAIASSNATIYREPLLGFEENCHYKVNNFILTKNIKKMTEIKQQIRNGKPDLIFLIGSSAASKFNPLPADIPILYCMILEPETLGLKAPNITGISLLVPHDIKLDFLKRISPSTTKIGLLYDPHTMPNILDELFQACINKDMKLFASTIDSSTDIAITLKNFHDIYNVDALYLPSDVHLFDRNTLTYISFFCIKNRIILIAPSAKFVKMGGLMAVDADLKGVGQQAGIIANSIMEGLSPQALPPQGPNKCILALNLKIASKIGLTIPPSLMKNAKIYK